MRVAPFAAIGVLLSAWLSPLPELVELPFARQMVVHIAVIAIAAPLLGVWLASVLRDGAPPLLAPMPASAVQFGVVWLWHMPLLHGLAHLAPLVWLLGQLSLLAAGVFLWSSALDAAHRGRSGDAILALLATSMQLVLLGTLLILAPYPMYGHGIHTFGEIYAQLEGQRLGGITMLLGGIPHLAGGLWLVDRLLRRPVTRPVTPGEAR